MRRYQCNQCKRTWTQQEDGTYSSDVPDGKCWGAPTLQGSMDLLERHNLVTEITSAPRA